MFSVVLILVTLVVQYSGAVPLKDSLEEGVPEELLCVVALFRHGDRAPSMSFPNDPYFDKSFWPMGFGELTNQGKYRLYHLGKWLRNRYSTFLPQKYSPDDIYARSTNTDRCLMSASAALAGLYPPQNSEIFNPELFWQPVPVHTKSPKNDEVLTMRKECKRYKETYNKVIDGEYFKNLVALHSDFFNYFSKHAGLNQTTFEDVRILKTLLESYSSYNPSFLPPWAKHLPKKTLSYLAGIAHARPTFNLELKRLLTGPFWANLLSFFDEVISRKNTLKLVMLAAHDTTVVSLLNCMGVYDFVPPVFGATLLWELRRKNGEIYVHVSYKRQGPQAEVLTVKGCEVDCNYKKFGQILEPLVVDSDRWEYECGNTILDNSKISRRTDRKDELAWDPLVKKKDHKPFFID